MDEPPSDLDAQLRVEAMTMGDRVAVLRDGVLPQCDTPIGLFTRPANVFVAGFIGSPAMNPLETTADGSWSLPLTPSQRSALSGPEVVVGVRPEGWTIGGDGVEAVVEVVEELGSDRYLYCRAGSRVLTVRAPGMSRWHRGERITLTPRVEAAHVFDAKTGGPAALTADHAGSVRRACVDVGVGP